MAEKKSFSVLFALSNARQDAVLLTLLPCQHSYHDIQCPLLTRLHMCSLQSILRCNTEQVTKVHAAFSDFANRRNYDTGYLALCVRLRIIGTSVIVEKVQGF